MHLAYVIKQIVAHLAIVAVFPFLQYIYVEAHWIHLIMRCCFYKTLDF